MKKTIMLMSIVTSTVLYANANVPTYTKEEVLFAQAVKKFGSVEEAKKWVKSPAQTQTAFHAFLGGGFGSSTINDEAVTFRNADDNNGLFEMGLGHQFNDNFFAELEYLFSGNNYTDSHIALGSLNYILHQKEEFSLYMGAVAGSQWLSWIQDPIADSDGRTEDSDAGRFVYGGQIGVKIDIEERYSLYAKYQYLTGENLLTKINRGPLYEESQNNFLIGVNYEF